MFKEKLNQIRVILGLEVKLASDKLIDGTSVEAEEFAPGFPLFVVAEDGTKSPAPMGEHETESGLKIEVDAEGKIISAETKAEEVADSPEGEVTVEAAAEDVIPASETPEEIAKKEAAVGEAMKKVVMALEEIATEMATMKAKMAEMESKYAAFSKTPGADKAPKVTRGEFASQTDSLDARIEALNNLKNEGFFKKNV
jgi:hypothetical protein